MHLAVYTSGPGLKAHIGLRKSGSTSIKSISLDSRLIFLNKELFASRLELTLNRFLGIKSLSKISDLSICIPGYTDKTDSTVVKSRTLNAISFPDDYNNFNFALALDKFLSKDKVQLISSYAALGLGAYSFYKAKKPLVVLSIDKEGVHVSIADKSGEVEIRDWSDDELGNEYTINKGKSLSQLLGDKHVDDILFSPNAVDAVNEYTLGLSDVVNHILGRVNEDGIPVNRVVLATGGNEFIDTELLKDKCRVKKIHVPNSAELNEIFFAGCFSAALFKSAERVIKNINYYAGGEHIHTFKSFEKFIKHFKGAKPIANGENFYKVSYMDGSKRKVKIKELKYNEDLEQFRF